MNFGVGGWGGGGGNFLRGHLDLPVSTGAAEHSFKIRFHEVGVPLLCLFFLWK